MGTRKRVFIAVCLSKYDIFEQSADVQNPQTLLKNRHGGLHDVIDTFAQGSPYVELGWYGFSSLGFVWDKTGEHYLNKSGRQTQKSEQDRVPQLDAGSGTEKTTLRNPLIVRPEGIKELFSDIRKFQKQNNFTLPTLPQDYFETGDEGGSYFDRNTHGNDDTIDNDDPLRGLR